MAKTQIPNAGDPGSIPGQGTGSFILRANLLWPKKKKKTWSEAMAREKVLLGVIWSLGCIHQS